MSDLTDFKACLKAIEEGNFNSINFPAFIKKFQGDPHKLGDHLQYALHKFCKQNINQALEATVIKLSCLCFGKNSVLGFSNMERFLGSLFHIALYLIEKEEYQTVLEICKSVEYRKTEIINSALENHIIRNLLYVIHSHLISAAQKLLEKTKDVDNSGIKFSHELAQMSINMLQLIKLEQPELGRKLLRNFKIYLGFINNIDTRSICNLYTLVDDTLVSLMPFYKKNDFLFYYVAKMNELKGESDMTHEDLKNHFKKHLDLIGIFSNDLRIPKFCDLFFSGEIRSEKYFKHLIYGFNKIISKKDSTINILVFFVLFNHVSHSWIKNYAEHWGEIFSTKIVQKLYNEIVLPMTLSLRNYSDYCRLADGKMDTCFSNLYIMSFLKIIHIIRLCLKYDISDSVELLSISHSCFQTVRESLNEIQNQCCLSQKNLCWNNLIILYTNTIEGLLRHTTSNDTWTYMKVCSEELIYELNRNGHESPLEERRIKILFKRWHYACLKLKDFNEALFVSSFYAVSYPEEEGDALSLWIQTKMSMTSESSSCLTFKDVIETNSERMSFISSKCIPCGQDLKKLLMMELRAYSSSLASNFQNPQILTQSTVKLWDILRCFDLKSWEKAAALNHVVMSTLSSSDSESVNKYKTECDCILTEILLSRTKRNCRSLLYAGNLKYSSFLCHLKSVQDHETHMNDSKSVLEYLKKEEEKKVKFGEVIDLNLTCDVMPSSNNFTVKFEENYLKKLNETFKLWEEAAEIIQPVSLKPYEFSTWLHNIKQISELYYLIGDIYQSIISWLLFYKVSKISNNRAFVLFGLSQIISHCGNVESLNALKEAEDIVEELSAANNEKDIIVTYWLAIANNYLRNGKKDKCFDYLCKLKDIIGCVKGTTKSYVQHARYWCLISKFLCLYPDYMENIGLSPSTELRFIAFKAFSYASTAVKDGSIGAFGSSEYREVLLTMLEVNVWASRLFSVYYQAAFIRLFLDDLYQVFQKLVLPTRTAFILVILAEVDVMCEKLGDAYTKLNSLKSILGATTYSKVKEEVVECKKPVLLQIPVDGDKDKESPRALSPSRFLDVHDTRRERDPSPLRFVLNEFDIMERLNHNAKCVCYSCKNLIIRLLNVNVFLLEAQVHEMNGLMKRASINYRECCKHQKMLETYQSELSNKLFDEVAKSLVGFKGRLDVENDLVKTNNIKVLISYTLFLLSPRLKENLTVDAHKYVEKIDDTMTGLGVDQKLWQWKILELKLILFTVHELNDKENEEKIAAPQSALCHSPSGSKTPVNSKKSEGNNAPIKYKPTNYIKSPNSFILKPTGRKIFSEDEDPKPIVNAVNDNEIVKKKGSSTRAKSDSKMTGQQKETRKKKAAVLVDVELLS